MAAASPVRDVAGKSKGTTGGTAAQDPEHTARFLDMLYREAQRWVAKAGLHGPELVAVNDNDNRLSAQRGASASVSAAVGRTWLRRSAR